MSIKLSVVIPVYNEGLGLEAFYSSLVAVLVKIKTLQYQIIFCDDGSTDSSGKVLQALSSHDKKVSVVKLARNFGKEAALAAGIAQASGDAIMCLDADGQHPPELIPDFIDAWQKGAKVVVGVRSASGGAGVVKRTTSRIFYMLFNMSGGQKLQPGSTDFRLIDTSVQKAFLRLHESERITRGLIDWLGFERAYIPFSAKPRSAGTATYSIAKLLQLARNSVLSLSAFPLYVSAVVGAIITPLSFVLGTVVFVEQLILGDPLNWNFTGTAMLAILLIFLVGIILIALGILSLYISRIHIQSQQRPLYIIDEEGSIAIDHTKIY